MSYQNTLVRMFTSTDDELYRIRTAETIEKQWRRNMLLILVSMVVYMWMAYLGMGSNLISQDISTISAQDYEANKFWFIVGRAGFGIFIAAILLFVPSLFFFLVTGLPYKKLVLMQQVVLIVMLAERIIWIPLFVYLGLDWYVSPFSLGIITSYLTDSGWAIYFFGSITLFQLWIIGFQVKYLTNMVEMKKNLVWASVLLLHLFGWIYAAIVSSVDTYFINGWFG